MLQAQPFGALLIWMELSEAKHWKDVVRIAAAVILGVWISGCSKAASTPTAPIPPKTVANLQATSPAPTLVAAHGNDVETELSVEPQGGTFVVPATINDTITLKFTIDSGASDVSIPVDVASTLVRSGTVTKDDFIGTQTYVLADGTQVPSTVFRIRTLKVGTLVLHDVRASLANAQGPLLLGQSFLTRMASWSFDNARQVLKLKAGPGEADQILATADQPAAPQAAVAATSSAAPADSDALLTDSDLTHVAALFHRTFRSSGMNGVAGAVTDCYAAMPLAHDLNSRKAAAFCITLDLVGLSIDTEFRKEMQAHTSRETPAVPFYEASIWQSRMRTYLPFTTENRSMPAVDVFKRYEQNAEQKLSVLLDAEPQTGTPAQ